MFEEEDGVLQAGFNELLMGFMPTVKEEGPGDIEDRHIEEKESRSLFIPLSQVPQHSRSREEYSLTIEHLWTK